MSRLERLLSAHGFDGDSRAEVEHALVYFLWPQVGTWDVATVPEPLQRLVAEHCLAAGIGPDTTPERAQEQMAAFFRRFPPDLTLVHELEELGLSLLGDEQEQALAKGRQLLDARPASAAPEVSGDTVPASPLARFQLEKDKGPKSSETR